MPKSGDTFNLIISESYFEIFKKLLLLIIGLLCSWKIPMFLGHKTGGVNGDTCGASVVLTETIILFIYAVAL